MKSLDFLKEGFVEDASEAHQDHEVQMARQECFNTAENALALHKLLRNISETQGLEGWVSSKITLANDYLRRVREYLEYEFLTKDINDIAPEITIAESANSKKKIIEYKIVSGQEGKSQNYFITGLDSKTLDQLARAYYGAVKLEQDPKNPNVTTIVWDLPTAGPTPYGSFDAKSGTATFIKKMTDAGDQLTKSVKKIGQGIVEDSLTEMDKSAKQPGRDGRISHKTYGSRGDEDPGTGPEKVVQAAKSANVKRSAAKELEKSMDKAYKKGVAEGRLNELAPNPGGGDGGGRDDGDDGFELPLNFKGKGTLVWPKNKKYSMGDTATPFPEGERFTGKVYIMWDRPKIEAIFYLDPKDREDREAEYERYYGPQGRGWDDYLPGHWYDTTTPRYRVVTSWRLIPATEPGGWPRIVDAWGQDQIDWVVNNPQNFINEIIQKDGDGRHFVEPKQSVTESIEKTFTVVYYSKKTDRNVTKQIKASSESELWDKLRAKGIDVVSIKEQGVAEGLISQADEFKVELDDDGFVHLLDGEGTIRVSMPLDIWKKMAGKKGRTDEFSVEVDNEQVHLLDGEGTIRVSMPVKVWKQLGQQGVAEGKKCNHTMEGTQCPVHGLSECPMQENKKLKETSAGSVAGVNNPPGKNSGKKKSQIGSLFGGTYKQTVHETDFAGEKTTPPQKPGDQVRGTEKPIKKGKQQPFYHRLVGNE